MKTYIFTSENNSSKRGYNRTITVYRIKNNQPIFIGINDRINTARYKGDTAIASQIISDNEGHKMDKTGYQLQSKNIKLFEV